MLYPSDTTRFLPYGDANILKHSNRDDVDASLYGQKAWAEVNRQTFCLTSSHANLYCVDRYG